MIDLEAIQNLYQAESHAAREFLLFIQELAGDDSLPQQTVKNAKKLIPTVSRELDRARADHIISKVPVLKTPVHLISKVSFGR